MLLFNMNNRYYVIDSDDLAEMIDEDEEYGRDDTISLNWARTRPETERDSFR